MNNMRESRHLILILIVLFILGQVTNGYKVLLVFSMPAKSHYMLGNALAKGLVAAGHDVTMIAYFEEKNPPPGGTYTNVLLSGREKVFNKDFNFFDLEHIPTTLAIYLTYQKGIILTKTMFEHKNVKRLLASNQRFDAIVMEQFCNDAIKGLGWYYDAPVILVSPIGANYWVNNLVGNPNPLSYVPELHLEYTENMTLLQRVKNTVIMLVRIINQQICYFPAQREILGKVFPGSPSLEELMTNVSLVLLNSHESTNQPVPLVPNMINVGGMHISPGKGLPQDLKDIMDSAKEGIVYFSMGSNIDPAKMKEEISTAILSALGQLPYKVLIKWHKDVPEKSNNIVIRQWFPQQDVLAHPNVKLFITHGGLLSTLETIYYGVPILSLPIFGDQKMNAAKAEAAGYGISMTFSTITKEGLSKALNEILNNKKYAENAKLRSTLMHDRITKPLDTAVYWMEYVIRNKGAPHLRVAAVNMPFYEYFLLDVIALLVLGVSIVFTVVYMTCKKICCSRKSKKFKNE